MNKEYYYEYELGSSYCYPNSNVLINKLGIMELSELNIAEREITAIKMVAIKNKPIKGKFEFEHLKRIHKYIFEDIFLWAGEARVVNISKGNQFCSYEKIERYAGYIFEKLRNENYLKEISVENLPKSFAYYFSEINVLHPFREGNGRTQRIFFELLADKIGCEIDFSNVSDGEMIEASAKGFDCDYSKLIEMFERITFPK